MRLRKILLYIMTAIVAFSIIKRCNVLSIPQAHQGEHVAVLFTYYDPTKGGKNCDWDCAYTASGERVLDNYNKPTGPWWWNGTSAGVACPPEYEFGTIFYVKFPDGTEGKFTCIDRGGRIKTETLPNGKRVVRLDILHYDDKRCGNRYCWPVTKGGHTISGSIPYEATVEIQPKVQTQKIQQHSNNKPGPTGRYCQSNYLKNLGKDPRIPEGMCPLPGWTAWCPYGHGKEDGTGILVSIAEVQPLPGVNCYKNETFQFANRR